MSNVAGMKVVFELVYTKVDKTLFPSLKKVTLHLGFLYFFLQTYIYTIRNIDFESEIDASNLETEQNN